LGKNIMMATVPPVVEIRELEPAKFVSSAAIPYWAVADSSTSNTSWRNLAFSRIADLERGSTAAANDDFKASEQAADRLRLVLNGIELPSLPLPNIVPLSGRGLMAEWRNATRAIEITVFADGDVVQEAFENREFNEELSQEQPDSLFGWLVSGSPRVHAAAR
jgi:hypothetical protein